MRCHGRIFSGFWAAYVMNEDHLLTELFKSLKTVNRGSIFCKIKALEIMNGRRCLRERRIKESIRVELVASKKKFQRVSSGYISVKKRWKVLILFRESVQVNDP